MREDERVTLCTKPMKTNNLLCSFLFLLCLSLCGVWFSGCGSENDAASNTCRVDLNISSSDEDFPKVYMVRFEHAGVYTVTQRVAGAVNHFDLPMGNDYQVTVYNEISDVAVNGNVATVAAYQTDSESTRAENLDWIVGTPDAFFSTGGQCTANAAEANLALNVPKRTHEVELSFRVDGESASFVSAQGKLSNVVASIDMVTGETLSSATAVMDFSASEEEDGVLQLGTVMNLLGVVPTASQKLSVEVTLEDGTVRVVESDLTQMLSSLNETNGTLELDADLKITDYAFTIENWQVIENDDIRIKE